MLSYTPKRKEVLRASGCYFSALATEITKSGTARLLSDTSRLTTRFYPAIPPMEF